MIKCTCDNKPINPSISTIDSLNVSFVASPLELINFVKQLSTTDNSIVMCETNIKETIVFGHNLDCLILNVKPFFKFKILSNYTRLTNSPKVSLKVKNSNMNNKAVQSIEFKGLFDYRSLTFIEIYSFIKKLNQKFELKITRLDISLDFRMNTWGDIKFTTENKKLVAYDSNFDNEHATMYFTNKGRTGTNKYFSCYSYSKNYKNLFYSTKAPIIKRLEFSFRKQIFEKNYIIKLLNEASIDSIIKNVANKKMVAIVDNSNLDINLNLLRKNLNEIFNYINDRTNSIPHLENKNVKNIISVRNNVNSVFRFLRSCKLRDYRYKNKNQCEVSYDSINSKALYEAYTKKASNNQAPANLFYLCVKEYFNNYTESKQICTDLNKSSPASILLPVYEKIIYFAKYNHYIDKTKNYYLYALAGRAEVANIIGFYVQQQQNEHLLEPYGHMFEDEYAVKYNFYSLPSEDKDRVFNSFKKIISKKYNNLTEGDYKHNIKTAKNNPPLDIYMDKYYEAMANDTW